MEKNLKIFWKRPATWFRWHRYLGYLIGLQMLAWIAGGLIFSIVPFQTAVKGKDLISKPVIEFPDNWQQALQHLPVEHGKLHSIQSLMTAQGLGWRLQFDKKTLLIGQDGNTIAAPNPTQIKTYAQSLYRGTGKLETAQKILQVPTQLGIVKEVGERKNLWQVGFKDSQNTRLYFDAETGEFITVRTDSWVWYDFFWRLHVMDYAEGEDFNNTLLRLASIAAFLMMITGLILSIRNIKRKRF